MLSSQLESTGFFGLWVFFILYAIDSAGLKKSDSNLPINPILSTFTEFECFLILFCETLEMGFCEELFNWIQ